MIVIVPAVYAPLGPIIIRSVSNNSDIRTGDRRVTRTKTLDGGAAIYHGGFSHADRTVAFSARNLTTAQIDLLIDYFQAYTTLMLYQIDGVYSAVPQSYRVEKDSISCTFLITEKIS